MSARTPNVPDSPLADPEVISLLSLTTLTLATVGRENLPHATPIYFAADGDLDLYFFSDPQSQHAQDLAHSPRCAAAIYPECQGWQNIHGLQMRGLGQPVDKGERWERAWQTYAAKFPFVSDLRDLITRNHLYFFIPQWLRLVDNRRGFGFRQEWQRVLLPGAAQLSPWRPQKPPPKPPRDSRD